MCKTAAILPLPQSMNLNWYFIEVCSQGSFWQHSGTDSDNGWAQSTQQAIIWTNDGQFTDKYMSLGLKELIIQLEWMICVKNDFEIIHVSFVTPLTKTVYPYDCMMCPCHYYAWKIKNVKPSFGHNDDIIILRVWQHNLLKFMVR